MIITRSILCPECKRSYQYVKTALDQNRGVVVFTGVCEAGHRITHETAVANSAELAQLAQTGIPRVGR